MGILSDSVFLSVMVITKTMGGQMVAILHRWTEKLVKHLLVIRLSP